MMSNKIKEHNFVKRQAFDIGVDIKVAAINVDQLQNKMSNALKDNNFGLVKYYSDRIVHSYHSRVLAVHRVITNTGGKTPGFLDQVPRTNADYIYLIQKIEKIVDNPLDYRATPLKRIYRLKADGISLRPISIPSYVDRCLQALFNLSLDVYCEHESDVHSYGFRKLRSPLQAIRRAQFSLNSPTHRINYVLEIDIQECFDNISHQYLLENIPMHKSILNEWLKCGYVPKGSTEVEPTEVGTPQGSLVSTTLCNMTLNGLESFVEDYLEEQFPRKNNDDRKAAILIRFADNIIYLCRSHKIAEEALKGISCFLKLRNLEIKLAKTKITDLSYKKGDFDFLGANFRRHRSLKVLTGVSKKNITKIKGKLKEEWFKNPFSMERIVKKSNPIIRGHLNYYRYLNTSRYKRNLHQFIFITLSRRAYKYQIDKTESRKLASKNVRKYYMYRDIKDSRKTTKSGSRFKSSWFKFSPFQNQLHYLNKNEEKLKLQNPFDFPLRNLQASQGLNYYQISDRNKLQEHMNALLGDSIKEKVMKKNYGMCGVCNRNIIADGITYEIHHITPRQFGGPNTVNNCIPLCKFPCHIRISKSVARYISSGDESHISEFENFKVLHIPKRAKISIKNNQKL